MSDTALVHNISGGDIAVWLDASGAICIKTIERHGDPVELSEDDALQLSDLLKRLVAESRGHID